MKFFSTMISFVLYIVVLSLLSGAAPNVPDNQCGKNSDEAFEEDVYIKTEIPLSAFSKSDEIEIDSIVLQLVNGNSRHYGDIHVYHQYTITHPDFKTYRSLDEGNKPYHPRMSDPDINMIGHFDDDTEHDVLRMIDALFIARTVPFWTEKEVDYIISHPGHSYLVVTFWCKDKKYSERVSCATWRGDRATRGGFERIFSSEFESLYGIVRFYYPPEE